MKREQHLGMWLAAGAALLLYYLSKNGLLHQSVTSSILTPDGTSTLPDPVTGAPQFDMGNAATVPAGFAGAVPPIDASTGIATTSPTDPTRCSCPQGYNLWHNVNPDTYWCIAAIGDIVQAPLPLPGPAQRIGTSQIRLLGQLEA